MLTEEQLDQGIASGMMTGLASSLEAGISTDASLDMRKSGGTSTAGPAPALYTVLEQEETAAAAEGLSAVGHTYKIPNSARPANAAARKRYADMLVRLSFKPTLSFLVEFVDQLQARGHSWWSRR